MRTPLFNACLALTLVAAIYSLIVMWAMPNNVTIDHPHFWDWTAAGSAGLIALGTGLIGMLWSAE